MDELKLNQFRRWRRKKRIRKSVVGTAEKPRLTVYRSNLHIYCQLIDDSSGRTLVSASTMAKDAGAALRSKGGNRQAAAAIGSLIAEKAKSAGITRAVFDRNGYRFQGRVKELAEAARKNGLTF